MSDELVVTMRRYVPDYSPEVVQNLEIRIPLRPLFAGLAMNGILATGEAWTSDAIVDLSVDMADAILKRLAEKPQEGDTQRRDGHEDFDATLDGEVPE